MDSHCLTCKARHDMKVHNICNAPPFEDASGQKTSPIVPSCASLVFDGLKEKVTKIITSSPNDDL